MYSGPVEPLLKLPEMVRAEPGPIRTVPVLLNCPFTALGFTESCAPFSRLSVPMTLARLASAPPPRLPPPVRVKVVLAAMVRMSAPLMKSCAPSPIVQSPPGKVNVGGLEVGRTGAGFEGERSAQVSSAVRAARPVPVSAASAPRSGSSPARSWFGVAFL